ncbi:MAG: hypothetical protein HGB30_00030 [Holophagaceae bacterium]|nr:hypothetical protein [Holophagaceae bacterium]
MKSKEFLTKCAWCDAVSMHSVWLPKALEKFVIKVRPNALISHGICEKCLKNHFLMAYNEGALHHSGSPARRPSGSR